MGYYTDKAEVPNWLKVGPNTKGTGRAGVPAAIAEQGKDRISAPVEDPNSIAQPTSATKLPQPRHSSGRFLPRPEK